MLNQIIIMGRLTRDPELRRTGSGLAVTSFSVAVERDYPNKDTGEREVDFIDCVAWRQTGEFVNKWFTKGQMIVVTGRLQMRNWTDKDGKKRVSAEILVGDVYFGESKKDRESSGNQYGQYNNPYSNSPAYTPSAQNYTYNSTPKYTVPVQPNASDFAMLDDDDAMLPF